MAESAPSSEIADPKSEPMLSSVEATVESKTQEATESSCNNNNAVSSEVTSGADREKSLEYAEELMVKGSKATKDRDYGEATECFSRALEIRVAHFGELSPECVNAYYKYGLALLYKAQEEADPLVSLPKKEAESQQVSDKCESPQRTMDCESSTASISSITQEGASSNQEDKVPDTAGENDEGEDDEESDDEDLAEADDDESDLDLAWKMLDVARAIVEKDSGDTMEKVDILSALAEVALEREDIETSLSDYLKALSILEHLVEPDSRHIAELNFRICLCLEIGSKAQEAIPYCQKALSVCKSRVQKLVDKVKNSSESTASTDSVADREAEIETLTGLSGDLEKKLEDLQQVASDPKSILSDILAVVSAKRKVLENNVSEASNGSSQVAAANSSGSFQPPTVPATTRTDGPTGVTHLGVVGRGVKRVLMNSTPSESGPTKKPASGPSPDAS